MFRQMLLAAGTALAVSAFSLPALAQAKGPIIGVSWSNFQEERWKTDEAAIKAAIEKVGGTYLSADAQSSPAKQLTDVESLIARGAKALIVLAQDPVTLPVDELHQVKPSATMVGGEWVWQAE